jgi:hypothetical protein
MAASASSSSFFRRVAIPLDQAPRLCKVGLRTSPGIFPWPIVVKTKEPGAVEKHIGQIRPHWSAFGDFKTFFKSFFRGFKVIIETA